MKTLPGFVVGDETAVFLEGGRGGVYKGREELKDGNRRRTETNEERVEF